jgi:uncharacterized BrkB/YihY/UPF0761 family membrane protein
MPRFKDGFHSDRRRGPDFVVRVAQFIVWFVWAIMFGAFVVIGYAKPPMQTYFEERLKVHLRTWWDQTLLGWFLWLMIVGLAIALLGSFMALTRNRRRSDRFPVSLAIMLVASIAGMIIFYYLHR